MDIVSDKIIMIPTSRKPNSNCLGEWGERHVVVEQNLRRGHSWKVPRSCQLQCHQEVFLSLQSPSVRIHSCSTCQLRTLPSWWPHGFSSPAAHLLKFKSNRKEKDTFRLAPDRSSEIHSDWSSIDHVSTRSVTSWEANALLGRALGTCYTMGSEREGSM